MISAPTAIHRPLLQACHLLFGVLLLSGLSGCLEDKKATEEALRMQKQNQLLMKQLQDSRAAQAQQTEQLKIMQGEIQRLKAIPAATTATTAKSASPAPGTGTANPPPSPTGPAPKNLPYSLYTGIVTTTKGESVELTSVNFGRIDRIPLIINNGNVEVSMGKVHYLRRLGKYDEKKKVFPVTIQLANGDEVRATIPVESVSGVDPRFGSKVEIPISTVIEIEFK